MVYTCCAQFDTTKVMKLIIKDIKETIRAYDNQPSLYAMDNNLGFITDHIDLLSIKESHASICTKLPFSCRNREDVRQNYWDWVKDWVEDRKTDLITISDSLKEIMHKEYRIARKKLSFKKKYNKRIKEKEIIEDVSLYEIQITINASWYTNKDNWERLSKKDTLTYWVLQEKRVFQTEYYKLFGFLYSDIFRFLLAHHLLKQDLKNSCQPKQQNQYKSFAMTLVKEKVLTRKEAKYYYKALVKGCTAIPWQVNKTCEYLKYRYKLKPSEKQCTILLKDKYFNFPRAQMVNEIDTNRY
jgi:hypothetical protein